MKNKVLILILGFVAVLSIGAGIFYYMNREIKGSPDDYVIQGDIIENKRAGLKIQAPQGWDIEKMDIMEGSMVFYTPDIESVRANKKDTPPLKKGCMIEVAVGYEKMSFNEIREKIEEGHKWLGMKSDKFETIEVNGIPALKNVFNCVEIGYSVGVYIPFEDKLYQLGIITSPQDIERCSQKFDEFLNSLRITN
ncbi:hypothetical protein KAW43_03810 [Candidatus Parcubacteria bacterium]|nr:hypothetical protein [Candidatus Parcubacteria bacterium]